MFQRLNNYSLPTMKKLIILAVSVFALFTSCQQRPQVFGVYIDGTFEEFMEHTKGYDFPISIDTNTIKHVSENEITMQAYSPELIDINAEIFETDTININIKLDNRQIHKFSYTLKTPISSYKTIRQACNRIYGSCGYYDVTEYSHACCWMIGKDCLWLVYDISEQQTKYTYIIN